MKVRDLMTMLAKADGDAVVVLTVDAEGNGYRPLCGTNASMVFDAEYGEVGFSELTDELREQHYGDEDIIENGTPCIVLWPA